MELHSLIIYILISINISYFVKSYEKPTHSSLFTRSQLGKLIYIITVIIWICLFFFIPIMYGWWYFLLEIIIIGVSLNIEKTIIRRPFLFGPLTTLVYLINLIYFIINF